MTIACDCKGVWKRIPLLNEDLVAYPSSSWKEINGMLACEGLDGSIFSEVFGGFVLYIVVESENWLSGILNTRCTDRFEPV